MSLTDKPKPKPLLDPRKYSIGIVCALKKEAIAVASSFDHQFFRKAERPRAEAGDRNTYSFGTIGSHHVVLAQLPRDAMGKLATDNVSADMRRSFQNIKVCLLVGICAICPQIKDGEGTHEALMGDVVLSNLVVQYDYGKDYPSGFKEVNLLERPEEALARAFADMELPATRRNFRDEIFREYLLQLDEHQDLKKYGYPGYDFDHLYNAKYVHKHKDAECKEGFCMKGEYCDAAVKTACTTLGCSEDEKIKGRKRISALKQVISESEPTVDRDGVIRLKALSSKALNEVLPHIFLGNVASGDRVLKNGEKRDKLAEDRNVIAFEMEGAGVWPNFPTVVIKAACDYGDSHKNKKFQEFACMSAAACAKAFLETLQMGVEENVEYTNASQTGARGAGTAGPTHQQDQTLGGPGNGVTNNWNNAAFSGSNIRAGNIYNTSGDQTIY